MFNKLLIILFVFASDFCYGFEFSDKKYTYKLVDVNRLSLEHKQYQINHDPYFPGMEKNWTTKTDLYWDVRLWRIFWDNDLHMGMDKSQVRTVGWKFIMGIHVTDWLDIVKDHHSRHVLEDRRDGHFPVEDSYGFRINFIERKK
jgi:hypothetical protein